LRNIHSALVLGGAGFLGRWVLQALVQDGVEDVVSVDRDPRRRLADLPVTSVQADLRVGDSSLRRLLSERRFDLIVQAIGTGSVPRSLDHPLGDLDSNLATTVALLEALRAGRPPEVLVHVSSAAVYGESVRLPMDEDHPLKPVSPYGISKLAAEEYVRLFARLGGYGCLSVRPFSIYGPGQDKLVVFDWLDRLASGENPLVIRARSDIARDLIYVEDVAHGIVRLARVAPARGEPYNLSSGRATTLGELADELIKASAPRTAVEFTGEVRPGDPLRWEGSPERARALGVDVSTPLASGLARTVEWHRSVSG
jgi:UDP-glucose 4-epimerase